MMRRRRVAFARRAIAVAACGAALALAAPHGTARADTLEKLGRSPPWDQVTKSDFVPPFALALVEAVDSPLEAAVKRRITAAINDLTAAAGPWTQPPARDLLRTLIAVVANDREAIARAGGLAAAALRAALVYAMKEVIGEGVASGSCPPAQRALAIYEGLGVAASLAGLPFPERAGAVPAACLPLAQSVQRMLDAAALRRLLTPELPRVLGRALEAYASAAKAAADIQIPEKLSADAKLALQDLVSAAAATPEKLAAASDRLSRVLPELRANAPELGAGVLERLDGLSKIDTAVLRQLVAIGLARIEVKAIVAELEHNVLSCRTKEVCAARDFVLELLGHLRSGVSKQDLVAAVRFVAEHLGITLRPGALETEVFDALEAAIVLRDERVIVDPDEIVKRLGARFGLDDRGMPSAGKVIGLPSNWIVDLNAGMPAFVDYIRVVGDAAIGYKTARFGVVTNFGINYYDLQTTGILTDNLHLQGGVDAFYLSGDARSKLRFQGRVIGGFDYYDATTIQADTTRASTFRFGDYDSVLLRGAIDVGILWRPNARAQLDVRAALGVQHESYDTTSLDASGVKFVSPETLSARGGGSFAALWKFWPQRLALRIRGKGSVFRLTRETVSFSAGPTGRTQQGLSATAETQVELQGRGYLDLDVLRLFGFVPAAWMGTEFVASAGASTFVPAAGLAIYRPD